MHRRGDFFFIDLFDPLGCARPANYLPGLATCRNPSLNIRVSGRIFSIFRRLLCYAGLIELTECGVALKICSKMCDPLGAPHAENKSGGPATQISFLGFKLDSKNKK